MVLSWVTKDALLQLDALIARRVQLDGHDATKFGASKLPGASPYSSNVASLTAADVNISLKLLQVWLQKFVTVAEVGDVFDHLQHMATRYESIDKRVVEKGDKPSTKDAAVTIDEKYDDSVTFFVLDTMTKVLTAVMNIDNAARAQDILPFEQQASLGSVTTTAPAVPFAFNYLHHSYSSAIRYGAARLLGVLSYTHLNACCALFVEKLQAAKKDEQQRDYASYQQAVAYLHFSVGDAKQALETNTFLYELARKMKDIDRGILRQEICSSLIVVFTSILSPVDAKRISEWEKFVSSGGPQWESWNNNYREIYDRVAKWASKDKHSLFSWELLMRMIVLSKSPDFYLDKKKYDVFSAVLKGLSKKEFRAECLVLMRNYVRDVPVAFINTDVATWSNQAKSLMQTLYGKKAPKPEDDEIPIMTDLFIEVGKKFSSYVITDVIADILKPDSGYYTRQKNIALKALSAITKDKKASSAETIGLAPLLIPFIEDAKDSQAPKQIMLMKAALQCWPAIRGATSAQIQSTAATIIPLTLHEDREVSTLAINCLQEFVLLDMNAYYLLTIHAMIDQLQEVDATQSIVILKICNNLMVLIQTAVDYQKQATGEKAKTFTPKEDSWLALREHLEAVALVRLTHTEGWVRSEVLRVLLRFNGTDLRGYEEKANQRPPRLVEVLLPGVGEADQVPSTTETFYVPLYKLITTHTSSTQFAGVIATAWSYLCKSVAALPTVDTGSHSGDEWIALFKNEFLFLCLTVRPGEGAASSAAPPVVQRQGSASPRQSGGPAEQGPLSHQELLLRFQQRRDRLNHNSFQVQEVYTFYETVVTFLQSPSTNPTSDALRLSIAADLSQVDVSNHAELLKHLRAPLTAASAAASVESPRQKIRAPSAKEGFYYHTYTLDLLSRLIIRVSPDLYHQGPTLLTKTLDDLVTQWTTDNPSSYAELPALTRYYMASLFTRFIFYRTVAKQHSGHSSKSDMLNKRSFFFSRIVALLSGTTANKDLQIKLESAVLAAVAALLALGPVNDNTLGDNILSCIEQELTLTPAPHIHDGVTLCLQFFFRFNPHRLSDFIRFTFPETHDPTSVHFIPHGVHNAGLRNKVNGQIPERPTATIIARYYAKALSAGFAHDMPLWTETHNITSAEMLLVSLLLMNSTDGDVRQAGLILVQEILLRDGVTLGKDTRLFSPTSPFMYTPGTIALAHDIAYQPQYLVQLPAVLKRAVDLFAHIQEQKKEILLRLLHPFTAQFSPLINGADTAHGKKGGGHAETIALVGDVLDSLFAITRLSSTSSVLSQSLKELWVALLSIDPITPEIVEYVLDHLIQHYCSLLSESSAAAGGVTPALDRAHPASTHSVAGSAAQTPTSSTRNSLDRLQSLEKQRGLSTAPGTAPPATETQPPATDKDRTADSAAMAPGTPQKSAGAGAGATVAAGLPTAATAGTVTPPRLERDASASHSRAKPSMHVLPEDAEDGDITPVEITPTRDILLEKALLRMIATHLSRGSHSMLIVQGLIDKLRTYRDECPTDPVQFLKWFTDHHSQMNEPTTHIERSAFELIVNAIFERTQEDLQPSLPTLLLNAYVLFPGSQLSDELLKNICLALKMLDVKQSAEAVISEAFFINNLSATHPDIRASFSQHAFIWSINSRDPAIATASFRIFFELEEQSFYFGPGQSTLIRVIELIYACLKNKETRRLKSIIATCLLPTQQPYDQQGWSALLAASIALLSSVDITIYQLGLQLFQHLFSYPIPVGRKKSWLVALGPFLVQDNSGSKTPSRVKKGDDSIDGAAVELLFRGLTHPVTCDETLSVLQTLMDYYAGTCSIPNRNKIAMTVELMNVLLRCVELQTIHTEKAKTGVQPTQAQLVTREKQRIKAVDATSRLALTLFGSADHGGDNTDQFNQLANIFKNLALSLSMTLPDIIPRSGEGEAVLEAPPVLVALTSSLGLPANPASIAADKQQEQLESSRTLLYEELVKMVKETGPIETVGALAGNAALPTPPQVLIPFFRSFTNLYDAQEHFDFVISWLQRIMQRYQPEWKHILHMMLGRYLLETQYKVNIDAFTPLSELIAQSYYSSDKDEQHLAENLAYLLVKKRGTGQAAKSNEVFNLIRTRASLRRGAISNTSLVSSEEKVDADQLLASALQRLQTTQFPVLQQMVEKARQVNRSDEQVHYRALKVSPPPSVLNANNNAADVAEQVVTTGDWHSLGALLSSGVHGGKPVSLSTIDLHSAEIRQDGPVAKQEVARVPFASLLSIAASSTRQSVNVDEPEPQPEANPFAAGEKPKSNPFGEEEKGEQEHKEEPAAREDSVDAEEADDKAVLSDDSANEKERRQAVDSDAEPKEGEDGEQDQAGEGEQEAEVVGNNPFA